jgi:hypothetical protein
MHCGLLIRLIQILKSKEDSLLNLPKIEMPKPSFLTSRRADVRAVMMTEDRALELEEHKGGNH